MSEKRRGTGRGGGRGGGRGSGRRPRLWALAVVGAVALAGCGSATPGEGVRPTEAGENAAVKGADANSKIAFTTDRDGNAEVYVMGADGSGPTNLTHHPAADGDPAWSPDGTRLAFLSERTGDHDVFVMNADGSGLTNLTDHPGADYEPAWSPDGTRIAFWSDRGMGWPDFKVYVMKADGTGVTQLTEDVDVGDLRRSDADEMPAWSPDGTKIAFVRIDPGGYNVFVMNADGTGVTKLTNSPGDDKAPAWSPDGTKIAFESTGSGTYYDVFVMKADGTGVTNLTNSAGDDGNAAWSPEGAKIAFDSDRTGNYEVFVMNADGTGVTNLTNDSAGDFDGKPAWQPRYPKAPR